VRGLDTSATEEYLRPMRRGLKLALTTGLALLAAAPSALADHHEALIGEVYPGTAANPDDEFVEVRMYLSGQNLFASANLEFYNPSGTKTGTLELVDVPDGANQRTILAGTPSMETTFTPVQADVGYESSALAGSGGGVCLTSDAGFGTIDCVAWGSVILNGAGTPAPVIADGSSLSRDLSGGCNTLLERTDDTDVSSDDLVETTPTPEPNSATPATRACPNTRITKKPKAKSTDRTPRFEFAGGDAYTCRLDGENPPCSTPFEPGRLKRGKHTLKVTAEDDGSIDPTPAKYTWKIVRK
jgi:hypothetical protein